MPTLLPRAACFDLETTAPPGSDARDPEQAIPVQAALTLLHPPGTPAPRAHTTTSDTTLLGGTVHAHTPAPYPQLMHPGCPISPESAEVHGITDAHVADAVEEQDGVADLVSTLAAATADGYVLIAANAHYDLTCLDRRARRRHPDLALTAHLGTDLVVFDPMAVDRFADKYRKGKRTLTDLCAFYRVPLEGAHDAGVDALAAGLVMARILAVAGYLVGDEGAAEHPEHDTLAAIAESITTPERFRIIAEMGVPELHAAQIVWRGEWASGFQSWLRHEAPAGRRDPEAVVNGAWPIIPARAVGAA